jgi:tyrosinase
LTPFWNADTTFWASAGTTDTTKLGYTYPEFNGLDLGNPEAVKVAIGDIVNQLYGSSGFGSFAAMSAPTTSLFAAGPAAAAAVPVEKKQPSPAQAQVVNPAPAAAPHAQSLLVAGHGPAVPPPHSIAPHYGLWDWTARIEFRNHELTESFAVLIFLGAVPEDPHEWLVSPNFVGTHHAFVNSAAEQCANCRSQANVLGEGFVHLNQAIARHSGLKSLEPAVVEPYLTKQLHWSIQKVSSHVIFSLIHGTNAELYRCRWMGP